MREDGDRRVIPAPASAPVEVQYVDEMIRELQVGTVGLDITLT